MVVENTFNLRNNWFSECCSIKSLNHQILGKTEFLVLKGNEIVSMIILKVFLTMKKDSVASKNTQRLNY